MQIQMALYLYTQMYLSPDPEQLLMQDASLKISDRLFVDEMAIALWIEGSLFDRTLEGPAGRC